MLAGIEGLAIDIGSLPLAHNRLQGRSVQGIVVGCGRGLIGIEFAYFAVRRTKEQFAVIIPYYPCGYSGQIKALILVVGVRLPFLVVLLQQVKHIHARTGRNEIKVLV